MIIGGISYGISSFNPSYESGITWDIVGGYYRPLDYGVETGHAYTTVTIMDTSARLAVLRAYLCATQGATVMHTLEANEALWGLEYDYVNFTGISRSMTVSNIGDIKNTNGVLMTLSFTCHGIPAYSGYILTNSAWPTGNTNIESYSTTHGQQMEVLETISGSAPIGFGWNNPITRVTYVMRKDYAGRLLAYANKQRATNFTLVTGVGVFGDGVLSNDVYILNYTHDGFLDIGGNWLRMSITYAKRHA